MASYDKELINEVVRDILAAGFRVFIAERGTYGIYTDTEGSRVVSFGCGLGRVRLSGCYKTSSPQTTGTGWVIGDVGKVSYRAAFNENAPQWAVGGATWRHTTLAEHLATYQVSSKYVEVQQ